ncbi:MAG TPA: ABC transporter permease [Bacteroidales bacterium]|nr:ABC transporter permease [Bacteroidales bacterium]
MRELLAILRKELIHIYRDKVSLFLVLAMPLVLIILFGFTISTEIKNAKISVFDQANDAQSKRLIETFSASGYFQVVNLPKSIEEINDDFKNLHIKAAIIIPPGFEKSLETEPKITIQVINDVSDINVASVLNNYIESILSGFQELLNNEKNTTNQGVSVSIQMLYNQELNSVYMFVPGIITLIMIIITALMSSITLARETETNTMRMMLITPVKKVYIVLGKVIPYMGLSLLSTIMILGISVWIFKMPIEGNIFLLLLLCIVFMFTAASFGLLVSSISKTQLDAMMITMMGLFLPTVLLSGFLFPLDNMPFVFQILADIFPAKWFILAIKDVMIKGATFLDIWHYLLILTVMSLFLLRVSMSQIDKRRKK